VALGSAADFGDVLADRETVGLLRRDPARWTATGARSAGGFRIESFLARRIAAGKVSSESARGTLDAGERP
jgi:hypothetical protein